MKDVILTCCMANYFDFNNIPHAYKVRSYLGKEEAYRDTISISLDEFFISNSRRIYLS